jgi:hypothetical protein
MHARNEKEGAQNGSRGEKGERGRLREGFERPSVSDGMEVFSEGFERGNRVNVAVGLV